MRFRQTIGVKFAFANAEMKVMSSHLADKTPEEAMMLANKEQNQKFWNPSRLPCQLFAPTAPSQWSAVAVSFGMIGCRVKNRSPRETISFQDGCVLLQFEVKCTSLELIFAPKTTGQNRSKAATILLPPSRTLN
jgi:hypothetical protein